MKIESSSTPVSAPLATRTQSANRTSSAGKNDVQLSPLSARHSGFDADAPPWNDRPKHWIFGHLGYI